MGGVPMRSVRGEIVGRVTAATLATKMQMKGLMLIIG